MQRADDDLLDGVVGQHLAEEHVAVGRRQRRAGVVAAEGADRVERDAQVAGRVAATLSATGSITPGLSSTVATAWPSVPSRDGIERADAAGLDERIDEQLGRRGVRRRPRSGRLRAGSRGRERDDQVAAARRVREQVELLAHALASRRPGRCGRISTSQSIAHLLGLGQQCVDGRRRRPLPDGLAELGQPVVEAASSAVEHRGAVVREDGVHSAGSPAAMRVVSRKPVAVRSCSSAGRMPASADASRCGRWLVMRQGPVVLLRASSRCDAAAERLPERARPLDARRVGPRVGVTTVERLSNRSASA